MKKIVIGQKEKVMILICTFVLGAFIVDKFFIADFKSRAVKIKNQTRLAEVEFKEKLSVDRVKKDIIADYEYCKPYFEVFKDDKIYFEGFDRVESDCLEHDGKNSAALKSMTS